MFMGKNGTRRYPEMPPPKNENRTKEKKKQTGMGADPDRVSILIEAERCYERAPVDHRKEELVPASGLRV